MLKKLNTIPKGILIPAMVLALVVGVVGGCALSTSPTPIGIDILMLFICAAGIFFIGTTGNYNLIWVSIAYAIGHTIGLIPM